MKAGAAPRATCPRCGRDVALRIGGELREHRARAFVNGQSRPSPLCTASGLTPVAVRNVDAMAARR